MKIVKKKYRIVPSKSRESYVIECWRWYYPFWTILSFWRDFETIDKAKLFIDQTRNPIYH